MYPHPHPYGYPVPTYYMPQPLHPAPPHMVADSNVPSTHVPHMVPMTTSTLPVYVTTTPTTPTGRTTVPTRKIIHGEKEWIGQLRTYGGNTHEEDAQEWLVEYEGLATSNNWTDPQKAAHIAI